jgi:hypothetical protein
MSEILRLRAADLEWREVDGEVVVLDLRDSTYFAVNKTAAAFWPALVEGATRDDLVASVTERYNVEEKTACADVDAFLSTARERGLLQG